jgi:hypothetical protein
VEKYLVEGIGLAGSLLVLLSMTMRRAKTLRSINLLGCVAFCIYGILIQSLSVTLLNLCTGCVNVAFLIKFYMDRAKPEAFDMLYKDPQTDEYTKRFIHYHTKDIKRFFPSFNPDPETGSLAGTECCLILRETLPVSLVSFRKEEKGITVILDYAIPAYRDFKNGKFFFETITSKIAPPGTVFIAVAEVPAHASYLRKLGFVETNKDESGIHFHKELKG